MTRRRGRYRGRAGSRDADQSLDLVTSGPPVTSADRHAASPARAALAYRTNLGQAMEGDSLEVLPTLESDSVPLILTSPPFALTREKGYGNEREDTYIKWFLDFAKEFKRVIREDGSIVIDLGGAWQPGQPTKSVYQFRLLLALIDELDLHLAQDFVWFNRSKMPGPVQWVNVDRVRVKDATNMIWWLSKTPHPYANNLQVLRPYTSSMKRLLEKGTYNSGKRPSEWVVTEKKWAKDRGGAIPPNVIEVEVDEIDDPALFRRVGGPVSSANEPDNILDFGNTTSSGLYHPFCKRNELTSHPARFPARVPKFFIEFLTKEGDLVVDPFGGSNVTGSVAEDLKRQWLSIEQSHEYIAGSLARFAPDSIKVVDHHLADLVDDLRDLIEESEVTETNPRML